MRHNPALALIIFTVIMLIIDVYSYWGIKKIIHDYSAKFQKIIRIVFWAVPLIIILGIVLIFVFQSYIPPGEFLNYFYFISGPFILFYIPKLVFILFNIFDDLIFLIRKLVHHKWINPASAQTEGKKTLTRRKFLNQVGIVFAAVPFISLFYGIVWGRFDFIVRKFVIRFPNIPPKFNGIKIVQFSDFHIGSFLDYKGQVENALNLINAQEADILLFTGDFVNNISEEMDRFTDILAGLKARMGKYSILGNHDYGDYVHWDSDEAKAKNLQRLIQIQNNLGFDLLRNESRKIKIEDQEIELIGVENWGLPPFPQYGDLDKALKHVDNNAFKILMTHDPTHFDEKVMGKTDIDFTLSGHTHGAQFGVEVPGWRWSPVDLRYKHWGGLYIEGPQKIYVNTGIGFIGFPGRVGMPPEVTVFELKRG